MPGQEEIAHQQNLLATHRSTLAQYLLQQAMLGQAYAPPAIMHGIRQTRADIRRIKDILRGWGVAVEDQPDDSPAADEAPVTAGAGQTNLLLALIQQATDNLKAALTHRQSDFFQKYVAQVYTQRGDAEEKFHRFVRQTERRCYVVTGRAGKGKTSLVCHLAESLINPNLVEVRLPILLNSLALDLEKRSLTEIIAGQLTSALRGRMRDPGFEDLARLLRDEHALLVVFIDAINELKGRDAFKRFNRDFATLLDTIASNDYPILFCVSCRSEFWPQFSSTDWARGHIAEPLGMEKPSYELGDFEEARIDAISQRYFKWYAIEGELLESARKSCCDPIMLRYLCAAYTRRSPNDKERAPDTIPVYKLGPIRTLRRKEAFDRFVEAKRVAMIEAAEMATDLTDARALYELTTRYLITMAYTMYTQGRSYITATEAFKIAQQLGHPDAALGQRVFLYDSKSIFFRFIDEGIILDKRDQDSYEFVFEAYFEYSLGRYIALERWPALNPDRRIDPAAIEEDLVSLLNEHARLVETKNFNNLFGAVQFAILIAEADHETEENRRYREHPFLFVRLIRRMSRATERGFDWIQQACATIRETALAHAGTWASLCDQPERLEDAEIKFRQLIGILDDLTKSSDFVVLWDLENTLQALAEANFEITIETMQRWAMEGQGLQPMFATQALARLSGTHPHAIVAILLRLAGQDRYRQDFWLARILIFAIREMARRRHDLKLSPQDWTQLQSVVREFAVAPAQPFIRGVALAALPALSQDDQANLDWVSRRIDQETWQWAFWNLAFELERWPDNWLDDWAWQTLDTLAGYGHDHVRYAVDRTAKALEARDPARAAALEERIEGSRWRGIPTPGRCDFARVHLIGIVYSPAYLEPAYNNHIECRERLQAILQKLEQVGTGHFNWIDPRPVTEPELRWAHNQETDRHRDRSPWPSYVEDVREASRLSARHAGPSTLSAGPSELRYESYETALLSAGGVLQAIDYVLNGPARAAWSLGRPPGHLANNAICIFNNIAIGAHYARRKYGKRRILIVDCDAHHGIHTNRVFRADPNVIYFSTHIDGEYAREEGQVEHIGRGAGEGYNFNLPYPRFMGDDGYAYIVDRLLIPLAREFKPEMILISAGFDGHFDDPLTPGCILSERAYIHLAERLRDLAAELEIKIVGSCEGGYGLEGLANSFVHMMRVVGAWPVAQEEIGFTPRPDQYEAMVDPEALPRVKDLVRRRVELMVAVRGRSPGYLFDTDQPHWQAILVGQA